MGEDCGSILISIPAARSCAAILSRSRTRKFSIQTFWASPKYLLVSGKGAKAVGPASCSQTGFPGAAGTKAPTLSDLWLERRILRFRSLFPFPFLQRPHREQRPPQGEERALVVWLSARPCRVGSGSR